MSSRTEQRICSNGATAAVQNVFDRAVNYGIYFEDPKFWRP
jgi:hypothetical protein